MNKIEILERQMAKTLHELVASGDVQICLSKDKSDKHQYYYLTGHEDQVDWTKFDKLGV